MVSNVKMSDFSSWTCFGPNRKPDSVFQMNPVQEFPDKAH